MNRFEELGLLGRYAANVENLARIGAPFVELGIDEATSLYLDGSKLVRHGRIKTFLHRSLRAFFSDFDINGWLGTYPMHVLSTAQWETLLGGRPGGRLLDVGSGRGDVTSELARLFDETITTETSKPMARRLRQRGFESWVGDLVSMEFDEGTFDAVSLLNVLDRCERPLSLLGRARRALRPGGLLLIALVLPYRPFVYRDGVPAPPLERLPIAAESFEDAATEFVLHGLLALGLEVIAVSRAPYLSGGDAHRALYELDDLLLVCRAAGEPLLVG